MAIKRVLATNATIEVIKQLQQSNGDLMFHLSGGCCDSSSPMCFPKGELTLNNTDVWLGKISNCNFYTSKDQFEYLKHTQLTVDVTKGRGSSFSLEIPLGLRFIINSRLFNKEEALNLTPIKLGEQL